MSLSTAAGVVDSLSDLGDFVSDSKLFADTHSYLKGDLGPGGLAPYGDSVGPGSRPYAAVGDLYRFVKSGKMELSTLAAYHDLAFKDGGDENTRQLMGDVFYETSLEGSQVRGAAFMQYAIKWRDAAVRFFGNVSSDDRVLDVDVRSSGPFDDPEVAAKILRGVGEHPKAFLTQNALKGEVLVAVTVRDRDGHDQIVYLVDPPMQVPPIERVPAPPALGPFSGAESIGAKRKGPLSHEELDQEFERRGRHLRLTQMSPSAPNVLESSDPLRGYPYAQKMIHSAERAKWNEVVRQFDPKWKRNRAFRDKLDRMDPDFVFDVAASQWKGPVEKARVARKWRNFSSEIEWMRNQYKRPGSRKLINDYVRYRRLNFVEGARAWWLKLPYDARELPRRRNRYGSYDSAASYSRLVDANARAKVNRRKFVPRAPPRRWVSRFPGTRGKLMYRRRFSGRTPMWRPRWRRRYNKSYRRQTTGPRWRRYT